MFCPPTDSFLNFLFSWQLVCFIPQYVVVDDVRPTDLKYFVKKTVYMMMTVIVPQFSALCNSTVMTFLLEILVLV